MRKSHSHCRVLLAAAGGAAAAQSRRSTLSRPGRSRRCRRRRRAGLERAARRLRRSAHDRRGDPRGGGGFPTMPRAPVAAGRAPRRLARNVYAPTRRADARFAHHGSARQPAGVHQVVLGLSRHAGDRRAHRARPRAARQIPRDLRRGRARLRRRPLYHRRDLGRGDQLRHARRRPAGAPLDRDARLHRPAAELFPRGISRRRWKFSSAATSGPTGWSAPGPALSGRRSSCRPRSSASRSTSIATAAATWSTRCPTSSPRPPTT